MMSNVLPEQIYNGCANFTFICPLAADGVISSFRQNPLVDMFFIYI